MAFRRSFKRRGGAARRMTSGSTRRVAVKAAIGVARLRKAVHPETFEYDTRNTDQLSTFTAVVTPISDLAAGDNDGDRTGFTIFGKSVRLSYDWLVNASNAQPQHTRVMIISDSSNTGATPTSAELFGALSGTENIVNAPIAVGNLPRFKVLYDQKHWLATASNQAQTARRFVKINKRIHYTGVNDTDLGKNQLWLVFMSSNSAANQPSFNYHTRLNYMDN